MFVKRRKRYNLNHVEKEGAGKKEAKAIPLAKAGQTPGKKQKTIFTDDFSVVDAGGDIFAEGYSLSD